MLYTENARQSKIALNSEHCFKSTKYMAGIIIEVFDPPLHNPGMTK